MHLRTALRVWRRWQAAAGTWQGWSVCPALLAPEAARISPMKATRPVGSEVLAARLGATLKEDARRGGGTAVVVDLEPVLAIHVAARLNQLRLANAVLLLPRWPYHEALLPVDALLGGLVGQAARLTPGDLSNVVFVLDAQRSQAVPRRSLQDRRADNRYRLTALDLPNLAALRARDIRRVITVTAT